MAETKYNLLTRLLKDLRNQVSSSGDIGGKSDGGLMVVHEISDTLLNGVLPNIDGYEFTRGNLGESTVSRFSFTFDIGDRSLSDIVVSMDGHEIPANYLKYENGKYEVSLASAVAESAITGLTITVTSRIRLDHTYAEIAAAVLSIIHASEGTSTYVSFADEFSYEKGLFFIRFGNMSYACETEADYPYRYEEDEEGPVK